jgi:hypothetical protein
MRTLDIVRLSPSHLQELTQIINTGRPRSRRVLLAMALIWLDCAKNGPGLSDSYVSNTLGLSLDTLEELKRLYNQGGPDLAINGTGQDRLGGYRNRIDLSFEEKLIALANSEAPNGKGRWSVRSLTKRAMELKLISSISHMTVHRLLKKHNFNLTGDEG